jgi:hypothetical protein
VKIFEAFYGNAHWVKQTVRKGLKLGRAAKVAWSADLSTPLLKPSGHGERARRSWRQRPKIQFIWHCCIGWRDTALVLAKMKRILSSEGYRWGSTLFFSDFSTYCSFKQKKYRNAWVEQILSSNGRIKSAKNLILYYDGTNYLSWVDKIRK